MEWRRAWWRELAQSLNPAGGSPASRRRMRLAYTATTLSIPVGSYIKYASVLGPLNPVF